MHAWGRRHCQSHSIPILLHTFAPAGVGGLTVFPMERQGLQPLIIVLLLLF